MPPGGSRRARRSCAGASNDFRATRRCPRTSRASSRPVATMPAPHLFPAWTLRVYHDHDVDRGFLQQLAALNVELRPMTLPADQPAPRRLLWRFDVIADPTVRRFLCRDADSLLTVKERVAID